MRRPEDLVRRKLPSPSPCFRWSLSCYLPRHLHLQASYLNILVILLLLSPSFLGLLGLQTQATSGFYMGSENPNSDLGLICPAFLPDEPSPQPALSSPSIPFCSLSLQPYSPLPTPPLPFPLIPSLPSSFPPSPLFLGSCGPR